MSEPYCGIKKPPKGYRRGNMKECAEKGKISYFGLKKVDPKIIEAVRKQRIAKNKRFIRLRKSGGFSKMNTLLSILIALFLCAIVLHKSE